jgi:lysophospholipase L1-like esterase
MTIRIAVLCLLLAALVACASGPAASPPSVAPTGPPGSPTPVGSTAIASSPRTVPSPTSGAPSGVVAIGHSGLTGEGTGNDGGTPAIEKSWGTGSAPEVNSVWLRLRAVRPDLAGNAVDRAEGGAPASRLPSQARSALEAAPRPALVIISTIDGDIRCDGSDAGHVAEFGSQLAETLQILVAAAPDTKILVVGQLGRPSVAFVKKLIAHEPNVADSLTGTGMCDFLNADGTPNVEHFKALTGIIQAYEDEQARVCAAVAQCRTDGGVRKAYVDVLENFSSDYNHLNIKGQAAAAALIWPVVENLLDL